MNNGINEKAFELFDLNIHNYPRSSNVYDLMGDCLLAKQDSTQALKLFPRNYSLAKCFLSRKKNMQKRTLETEEYFYLKLYLVVKVF